MKRLIGAVLVMTLAVPVFAGADDAVDAAARETGAVRTKSGMVYRSIKEGEGASPGKYNMVEVNYRGTLTDGKEFDRGLFSTFPLSRVIPCWTEGVQKMKVGGKAKLVCPPGLAYGPSGAGSDIPPNATLIFEIELLKIK